MEYVHVNFLNVFAFPPSVRYLLLHYPRYEAISVPLIKSVILVSPFLNDRNTLPPPDINDPELIAFADSCLMQKREQT